MNSRQRVVTVLDHRPADRVPVDFLAVPEIWRVLERAFGLERTPLDEGQFFDPVWEAILRRLEVDCRVVSYDQFCAPPSRVLAPGDSIEWWDVQSRSTPSRMWRRRARDGNVAHDVLGRRFVIRTNPSGSYEENVPVLASASLEEVKRHPWPEPSWWDFSRVGEVIADMNAAGPRHVRYRLGSVFEVAWQLRGLEQFMMDMAIDPDIPRYMMDRLTELYVENLTQVLARAGEGIDLVYFYDDVASNTGLLLSEEMWEDLIRPCHVRLVEAARRFGKKVMYHSDGAMHGLLPRLIELGVDVLNPHPAQRGGHGAGATEARLRRPARLPRRHRHHRRAAAGDARGGEGRGEARHLGALARRRLHPGQLPPHPGGHAPRQRPRAVRAGRPGVAGRREGLTGEPPRPRPATDVSSRREPEPEGKTWTTESSPGASSTPT